MAKKQAQEQPQDENLGMDTGYAMAEDFNVEEEFKPSPLVATGVYHSSVTQVKFNPADQTIDWTYTLNDNGGVMSDGETPIDGAAFVYRNWLPRPGDEDERTKDGRQTKRQAKINMLGDFSNKMGVNMSTPTIILESIANSDWVGIDTDVKIRVREYEGRIFNDIERIISVG